MGKLLNLFIVNKAGGLVYHCDNFSSSSSASASSAGEGSSGEKRKLTSDEYLQMGSTFHSLHAIASQISPVKGCKGIEYMDAGTFVLYCFQSATGIKFFATAEPNTSGVDSFLIKCYELYCDFVMKNPFHELDMPIRSELFDRYLFALVTSKFDT